jgi:hypothetical protein
MEIPTLTPRLVAAVEDRTSGATGVARQVIKGLLEFADERDRLRATADLLFDRLPWYAPMWHVVRAAYSDLPRVALRWLLDRLDADVEKTVAAAVNLLKDRGGSIHAAPSSALVKAVTSTLATLNESSGPSTGLAGADAIGSGAILNIIGTHDLARTRPTIVVTTSLKLVPEQVFQRLGGPEFERIPLAMFSAVVLDGEVLTPAEVGERAMRLSDG